MVFPFTFSVPLLYNPFTTLTNDKTRYAYYDSYRPNSRRESTADTVKVPSDSSRGGSVSQRAVASSTKTAAFGCAPSPGLSASTSRTNFSSGPQDPPTYRSRKRSRGWEPSNYAQSATVAPSNQVYSRGYIDTPKMSQADLNDDIEDLPAHKRRRTLAGSILSTAINAAVIGSAVGLTVYRLWRDRGKEPVDSNPPPPYSETAWTEPLHLPHPGQNPNSHSNHNHSNATSAHSTPASTHPDNSHSASASTSTTPRRRAQQHQAKRRLGNNKPRASHHHHLLKSTPPLGMGMGMGGTGSPGFQPKPEFDFRFGADGGASASLSASASGRPSPIFAPPHTHTHSHRMDDDDDGEDDPHLASLSSKLSSLIESGKRALGAEVVVMSDALEDAVDDGSQLGAWVADDEDDSASMRGHKKVRRGRERSGSASSLRSRSSPRRQTFGQQQYQQQYPQQQQHQPSQYTGPGHYSRKSGDQLHVNVFVSQTGQTFNASPQNQAFSPSASQGYQHQLHHQQPHQGAQSYLSNASPYSAASSPVSSSFSTPAHGEGDVSEDLRDEMEKARRRVRERMGLGIRY